MNKKNGINKVNTNVKSSKFGINQNIKNLSQKNYKKAKINSTTNKIKKTNSPKNLNNQETGGLSSYGLILMIVSFGK